jgi:hypothetical protein
MLFVVCPIKVSILDASFAACIYGDILEIIMKSFFCFQQPVPYFLLHNEFLALLVRVTNGLGKKIFL